VGILHGVLADIDSKSGRGVAIYQV
jgi:hypothetical protein